MPLPAISGSECVTALEHFGFAVRERTADLVRMGKGQVEVAVPLTPRLEPAVVDDILGRVSLTEGQLLNALGQVPTPALAIPLALFRK